MERQGSELILSYLWLRRAIGVLGLLVPVAVPLGGLATSGFCLRGSISAYYYSNMRDAFVGLLCMVGVFLLSYRGHDLLDRVLSLVSGFAALGVAAFPTLREAPLCPGQIAPADPAAIGVFQLGGAPSAVLHFTSAVVFFTCLAVMSLFRFTRSDRPAHRRTPQKQARNKVYVACGVVMLAALVTVPIAHFTGHQPRRLVLGVETVCLLAFGLSWLVKGETLWRDPFTAS